MSLAVSPVGPDDHWNASRPVLSLRSCPEFRRVVANALKFEGVELAVQGESDDELAASLVDEMVRTGLTRRM